MRELIEQRTELLTEDVLTKKWLAGVKKWWKQWVAKADSISKLRDPDDKKKVLAYFEDGEKRLQRFKDNLDFKKGGTPFPNFLQGNRKENIKQFKGLDPRVDLAYMFNDAFEKFSDLRSRINIWWNAVYDPKSMEYPNYPHAREEKFGVNGMNAYEAEVNSIKENVPNLDKVVSGKLFRRLNRYVSEIEGISGRADMGAEGESELSLGRAKIIFDVGQRDVDAIGKHSGFTLTPSSTSRYVKPLSKAKALLDKAGFGKTWYGEVFIRPDARAHEFKGATTGKKYKEGAHWSHKDHIVIFGKPVDSLTELMIHEIGHRWYYKFMNQGERARFDQYFGDVPSVSSYGGEKPGEDFAEVFRWYVLGKKLTGDQRERFKQFALKGGKVQRHEDKEGGMRALIERLGRCVG